MPSCEIAFRGRYLLIVIYRQTLKNCKALAWAVRDEHPRTRRHSRASFAKVLPYMLNCLKHYNLLSLAYSVNKIINCNEAAKCFNYYIF